MLKSKLKGEIKLNFNPLNNPFKSFDTFNFNNLQEILDKNKDMISSFFGNNQFDENFMQKMMEKGTVLGQESPMMDNDTKSIPMDMIQRKHEVVIILEIPGLNSEEDVDIKVLGSTLIIEGEIRRK